MSSIEEIEQMVSKRLGEKTDSSSKIISGTYQTFVQEEKEARKFSTFFEKYCDFSVTMLRFFNNYKIKSIEEALEIASINATSGSVFAGSIMAFLLSSLGSIPFLILNNKGMAFFMMFVGIFLAYVCYSYPDYSAEITRIKAQEESLLAILYMTIYMRVNPVLENAVLFAASHLSGCLGKDLKTIIWLLDSEKVNSIEEATRMFVPLWMKRNKDFVKAFMTLQTVILQQTKEDQERILDKTLNSILDDTYEKMKHYSHDLKMPVLIINTFGLMLPLVGLLAFPMMSVFMSESINISYLFFGYIIVLPSLIWFMSQRILSKRPGAFSAPDVSLIKGLPKKNRYNLKIKDKEHSINLIWASIIIGLLIMTPGLIHLFFKTMPLYNETRNLPPGAEVPTTVKQEYELSNMLKTLTIPVGLAVGIFVLFYGRSIQKKRIRDQVVEIEDDLTVSLFQLSNQFTENIPVEIAVEKFIANYELLNLKKRQIYTFFSKILDKMKKFGKTFSQAVFDSNEGIILEYPSVILKEIMLIMTESAKKGAHVVYNIMSKISIYLDNVKKIKELIYDLLAETVSSVKMQAKIMSPFIAAIVGSLTLIIIEALYKMFEQLEQIMKNLLSAFTQATQGANFFTNLINFAKVTPPTLFQVLVGIYMIEAVVLLSRLATIVENGFDDVETDINVGKNVLMATIIYCTISIIGVVVLKGVIKTSFELGVTPTVP